MSFFNYTPFPMEQPQPVVTQQPLATDAQMREYDEHKRKNNGLIIGLVIIVILLVAAIIAIFVLLYAPNVLTTGTVATTSSTIQMKMEVQRSDVSFGSNYASSAENGFNGLVTLICDEATTIGAGLSPSLVVTSCSATTMSAVDAAASPTGVKVEDFTINMNLGSVSSTDAFSSMAAALVSGFTTPYSVDSTTIVQVTSSTSGADMITSLQLPLLLCTILFYRYVLS